MLSMSVVLFFITPTRGFADSNGQTTFMANTVDVFFLYFLKVALTNLRVQFFVVFVAPSYTM